MLCLEKNKITTHNILYYSVKKVATVAKYSDIKPKTVFSLYHQTASDAYTI